MSAKQTLSPLSSGSRSKDHGTHNAPIFPRLKVRASSIGENTVVLNLGCGNLKGLGKLKCTLNTPEGEARLDAKRVGSAHSPICLWHMFS